MSERTVWEHLAVAEDGKWLKVFRSGVHRADEYEANIPTAVVHRAREEAT